MNIKIIGLDLDGTTLTRDGQLPEINKYAIERAIASHIHVVVATGRVLNAVPDVIRDIEGLRYIISSNGAHIRDLKINEDIYSSYIDSKVIEEVVSLSIKKKLSLEAFHDGKAYIDARLYDDIKVRGSVYRNKDYVLRTREPIDDIYSFMLSNPKEIENINIFFDDLNQLEEIKNVFNKFENATVTSSLPNNIEIGGINSSKSKALSKLIDILGLKKDNLLCCGDAANDIPMIELAEIGVAMGNAWDIVKEHADYVADTNINGGVGKAILKFAFGEEI